MDEKTLELTQSEPTNRLLLTIREVLAGQVSENTLKELVEQRKAELVISSNDFRQKTASLPAELNLEAEAKAIQDSFSAYEEILNRLEQYLLNHNREILEQSDHALIEVTARFIKALSDFDQKYWMTGASVYPLINMLARVMEGLTGGTLTPEYLSATLDNIKNTYRQAIKDLKKIPQGDGRSIRQIEEIYQEALKILDDMHRQAEGKELALLEKSIKRLEVIQDRTEKAFQTYRSELYLTYPTASPFINLVLSAVKGIKEGYFTDDILKEATVILNRNYQEVLVEMEKTLALPIGDLTGNRPFSLIEEALSLERQYQESKNKELLSKMEAVLIQAAGELLEVTQTGELPNTAVCIQCRKGSPAREKVCIHCGAALPQIQEDDQGSTFQITEGGEENETEIKLAGVVLTDNFKRILDAVDGIIAQTITPDDFESTLNWMDTLLQVSFNELRNLPGIKADNYQNQEAAEIAKAGEELIDGTKSLLASGLVLAQNGIAEMRKYLENGAQEHLSQGLKIFWQGAGEISNARQIGENVNKLIRDEGQVAKVNFPQDQVETGAGMIEDSDNTIG